MVLIKINEDDKNTSMKNLFRRYDLTYTVSQEFPDSVRNMLLSKNPQFLPDHYETLTKGGTHEDLIRTKLLNHRVKIVDFPIKAYF